VPVVQHAVPGAPHTTHAPPVQLPPVPHIVPSATQRFAVPSQQPVPSHAPPAQHGSPAPPHA
jgi:hypothetical protein